MTFHILTLFPQTFESVFKQSILARAIDKKIIKINFVNPRDFSSGKHKTVDDKPYGGGKGMVMKVDVTISALESINPKPYTILLSASGKKYDQKKAVSFTKKKSIALICGHYEGTDTRIEKFTDETLSIGDFVLTGGEIAAMAVIDSVTRLLPGTIHPDSPKNESFSQPSTLLEYPQYTRPENFRGLKVPNVLLSGNHRQIQEWRQKESIKRTKNFHPDLLKK